MPTPVSTPEVPLMTDPFKAAMEKLRAANEVPVDQTQASQMGQMQNDIWRLNMMQLPENTGGSMLDIYGSGQVDPKTGKMGQVSPEIAMQRLQQVYANRPDLIWPGQNKDGTIDMSFTGDRYDR
jgi:hypothetical protein